MRTAKRLLGLMTPILVVLSAVSTLNAAPVPAAAKEADLPIPAKSLLVFQARGLKPIREQWSAMMKAAAPDVAPAAVAALDAKINELSDKANLKALRPDGRIVVILTDFQDLVSETPQLSVLLPITEYKSFHEQFLAGREKESFKKGNPDQFQTAGDTIYAIDLTAKGGYVALTPNEETAELFSKAAERLDLSAIDAGVAETFLKSDVSVFLNVSEINDRYGAQIRNVRQLMRLAMQPGGFAGGGLDEKQLEMARLSLDGTFQMVEDSRAAAIGISFSAQGLAVRAEAAFAAETPSAEVLAKESPTKFPKFGELPSGQATYVAGKTGETVANIFGQFNREFRSPADNEASKTAIDNYQALYTQALSQGYLVAGSGPKGSLVILRTDVPKKLVAAELEVLKSLAAGSDYLNVVLKEKPTLAESAETVAGFTLHRAELALDFEATVKGIPDENLRDTTIASMKRFVAEKPILWFGTDGKVVVKLAAENWATAKQLLEAYQNHKKPIGDLDGYKDVVEHLPQEASMLVLSEVDGTLMMLRGMIGDMLQSVPGLPVREIPELQPSGQPPTFVGTSIVLKPQSARIDFFVPVSAMKAGRAIIEPAIREAGE